MRKQLRSIAKSSSKSRTSARKITGAQRASSVELSLEEVTHLEEISRRYEQSERAWQLMTALPGGDETWNQVEEHLFSRGSPDPERRWKYFSK